MNENSNAALGRIAALGLRKCVDKLTRVSAGAWSIACTETATGTIAEAVKRHAADEGEVAAVYFEVKGELPFIAIIFFSQRDIGVITKCMLGYTFSASPSMTQTGELLLSELGNIILNSLVSSFSNALKRVFMPTAPRCLRGEPKYLLEAMGVAAEVQKSYRTLSIKLDIQCGKNMTRSEVLGLIPEKLEQELLKV